MSQSLSETCPVARNSSMQERLSARQAKRAAKAAERRERSDVLKEEGNAFFQKGDFERALERYQQAMDVHGPSAKPVLLANLAAAYLKLGLYPEAEDAADRALIADPASVKARYRRGMARKHMENWTAAAMDLRTVLTLDPGNKDVEAKLDFVKERSSDATYWEDEGEESGNPLEDDAPALGDDPELDESLSESSDCEHRGNGVPCKFYNRSECKYGRVCRFSHAPDEKSKRDALGRNVCLFYLMDACKFGERCSYLHSKEHLLQEGWWSTTTEGIEKRKKRSDIMQKLNKAVVDYESTMGSAIERAPGKKQPKEKKKRPHLGRTGQVQSAPGIGQPSRGANAKSKRRHTIYPHPSWGGHDSDGDDGWYVRLHRQQSDGTAFLWG